MPLARASTCARISVCPSIPYVRNPLAALHEAFSDACGKCSFCTFVRAGFPFDQSQNPLKMPSFDIASKVDAQNADNAVNAAKKEIANRYDFRGSESDVSLDKKSLVVQIITDSDFRIDQIEKVLLSRFNKAGIEPQSLDLSNEPYATGKLMRKEIPIKQGIDRETAKKITKAIKAAKIKADTQVMEDQIRVSSKSINSLQEVIALCKKSDFGMPLQYINMK